MVLCASSLRAAEQVHTKQAPHMLEAFEDGFEESTLGRLELDRRRPGTGGSYGASSGGILSRLSPLRSLLPCLSEHARDGTNYVF